ncbi:MAG: folate-binding protein YgfZ [Actinobacteria bacterium]|nr:folate-binding protein YgfZ [Actinomycetota bacterium]
MSNIVSAWFDRSTILATGPDAERYLQGQLSADIAKLEVGDSTWSLLLAPTGKMIAWLRVSRTGDESFVIDLDPAAGEEALARLLRFKLRVDADLTLAAGQHMLSVRSLDGRSPATAAATPALDAPEQPEGVLVAVVPGRSIGVAGYDLIAVERSLVNVPAEAVEDPAALEADRIAHGIPLHGAEIDADVIPGELGAWLVEESVSWTKGCYTGQELVARIDSRGNNTPRRLSVLTFAQDSVKVALGIDVVDVDGGTVGIVTSTGEGRALALLKRSVEPGSTVLIEGHEATTERMDAGQ